MGRMSEGGGRTVWDGAVAGRKGAADEAARCAGSARRVIHHAVGAGNAE